MEFVTAATRFNSLSDFKLVIQNPHSVGKMERFTEELLQMTKKLEEYVSIRERGYSDDHLATEIGQFVLHLNQVALNVDIPFEN
tara:strand:- start:51 stop:302 length:252 start_codon:yes stop_codon:yes gene_type:complete